MVHWQCNVAFLVHEGVGGVYAALAACGAVSWLLHGDMLPAEVYTGHSG